MGNGIAAGYRQAAKGLPKGAGYKGTLQRYGAFNESNEKVLVRVADFATLGRLVVQKRHAGSTGQACA
jgi:hypothetical protein